MDAGSGPLMKRLPTSVVTTRTSAHAHSRAATSTALIAATLPLTPSSTRGRLRGKT